MLKLNHVCAGYGDVEILHDVSCHFEKGKNYCILGPNGCGKTTLIRAMAGLIPATGTIELESRNLKALRRKEIAARVAVMSQITQVYFPYTVYDTVMLGRYQHIQAKGLFAGPAANDREKVEECLETVGLQDLRHKMIDTLSGGERQRVFLAQALAQEPGVILLDEPTNHLDLRYQMELIDYLAQWSSDGQHSVIGVLHDMNLALHLTRNVLFMQAGRIVRQGLFDEIADSAFLNQLYGADIAGFMKNSFERWQRIR